jgi:hypothetical protein
VPIAAQIPWPSEPVATSTHGQPRRRMAFEIRREQAQREQLIARDDAGFGPRGVEDGSGMALRQDEAIVVLVARIARVVAHLGKEQRRHDLGGGTAGRGMSRSPPRSWHEASRCASG